MKDAARKQWLSDIRCLRWYADDAGKKLIAELAAAPPTIVATSLRVVAADAEARAFLIAVAALRANRD